MEYYNIDQRTPSLNCYFARDLWSPMLSLQEFVALDRRYTRVRSVFVRLPSMETRLHYMLEEERRKFAISESEVCKVAKVIKAMFGVQITNQFHVDKLVKPCQVYQNAMNNLYQGLKDKVYFQNLNLFYTGPESEQFLEYQVANAFKIDSITLTGTWKKPTFMVLKEAVKRPELAHIETVDDVYFKVDFDFVDSIVKKWTNDRNSKNLILQANLNKVVTEMPSRYKKEKPNPKKLPKQNFVEYSARHRTRRERIFVRIDKTMKVVLRYEKIKLVSKRSSVWSFF
ncbi:hypothetical protein L596_013069 [Steinernema carpocapsae]|uniref:Uncharacterized protein n=1 Tax=Steinernema carpocapsae TaxID=34508 RepID=A0A4U5NYZ7_STECR|nr:hypothetical protein L596_013069 [Steinernema carpocapsae]